ncbi:alpha/beta-hydrolase [Calocera viscosa TUFC12733]|uniref:Alpha/beta-hydrolase n=1 Tax=Calocera viscosa (strain TUFC12733) TaxID=1330018 RepID=A0A167HLB9_CALVF|nr:alpha/beta-hydrolase [Calocera viscosa TUFC12733]
MLALISFLPLAAVVYGSPLTNYTGPPNAHCARTTYRISLPPYTTIPFNSSLATDLDPTQPAVTELQAQFTSSQADFTEDYMSGTNSSTGAVYDISGVLCTPKGGDKHNGTIQLLVHGIAFDSSYWDLAFQPENYSYVWRAAAEGYTTFRYDRLGTGESDHPFDGYHEVQAATDLQILLQIISLLHSGGIGGNAYSSIFAIGHSYGSIQLAAASGIVPGQLSALVLTGFSANGSYVGQFQTSNAFSRADETQPSRFTGLPGSYVISGLPQSSQINFFYYPFYDLDIASFSFSTTQPVTQGVLFTFTSLINGASNFTGPVHVVTGDRDWVFCGAQCDIEPDGQHTILELVGPTIFPQSSNFSVFSPANTGHGLNMHLSTPDSYTNIMDWLNALSA